MSELPITNIVDVTVTSTPSGLSTPNVNSVGLFTNETPSNIDAYRIYVSASQVAEDYGSSSVTYQMAVNIFSQSPNILSGGGRLVIIPLQSSVSATEGDFETADISSNLTALKAVSDGDLKVTLNGTDYNLTGLDFTNCVDLEDIATIIQRALPNAVVTATTTAITIQSKKVGATSTVALDVVAGGTGTDLTAAGLLNTTAGTATGGADSTGETIEEAITRIANSVDYTGVVTNLNIEDGAIDTIASAVQSLDKIFLHHFASAEDILGECKTIKDASQTHTRCLVYTENQAEANLMKSAYVGRMFSVNFDGSRTCITANLKVLANVTADSGITQTHYDNAKTNGVDLYVSYNGLPRTLSSGGNTYFDRIYNQIALKYKLQTEVANYLATISTKIPQTEEGMNGLKTAISDVMKRFVTNGYIGIGLTWTSADTFGNPEDLRRNITDYGYYIYSLPIAQQTPAERATREAPLVQIAVKEAGAIHSVIINVIAEA